MRDSLLRRFVSLFGVNTDIQAGIRNRRRATRRLTFQVLEARQMFSAAEIVAENLLPGYAGGWTADSPPSPGNGTYNGSTDDTYQSATRIQGYTSKPSFNLGEPIEFKIDSESSYDVRIFRMGYYGGLGVRYVASLHHEGGSSQEGRQTVDTTTGLVECNWTTTLTWDPPDVNGVPMYTAPEESQAHPLLSGVYYALLVRFDPNPAMQNYSSIPFVIRDDGEGSAVVMQTADTTWQAYNHWGGKSLYWDKDFPFNQATRAYKVSYNRPYDTTPLVLVEERSGIWFMEKNGYDITYTTHVDVDRYYNTNADAAGNGSLRQHQVYMVGGHDEYWSGEHVKALEGGRMNDVSLFFMSGNEGFWKTRWEDNYQTLVCYKETQNNGNVQDPTNIFTGLFQDLRAGEVGAGIPFNPEREVTQPENALTGTIFAVNFTGNSNEPAFSTPVNVSAGLSSLRFWNNSRLDSLGGNLNIPMGAEWDHDLDNGFRPSGLVDLSRTTVTEVYTKLQDFSSVPIFSAQVTPQYGKVDANNNPIAESVTHSLTVYRSSENAIVFSAGMSTWSWALSSLLNNPNANPPVRREDDAVKQATANILADMGVPNPLTPEAELGDFGPSTDFAPPISSVTATSVGGVPPAPPGFARWTVSGNASDSGGLVAGVEVSYNGGATWHPAVLNSSPASSVTWTYVVDRPNSETPFFLSRAVDDSYNMQAVKAISNAGTLYVYGGSADNNIVITKNGGNFTVSNNSDPLGTFTSAQAIDIVVQVAIGENNISIADAALAGSNLSVVEAAVPTVSGSLYVRGGIGRDTITLDHVKVNGSLTVDGKTGVDTVNLTTSVVQVTTDINTLLNGNTKSGSDLIGATINLQGTKLNGNLTVRSGNANDRVTLNSASALATNNISTRGGNDTINWTVAVDEVMSILSGDGDDTFRVTGATAMPEDPSTFNPGGGSNEMRVLSGNAFVDTPWGTGDDLLVSLSTIVESGAHLQTNRLWQTSVEIEANGKLTLKPDGSSTNTASKINTLIIASSGTLDLTDQALIIDYPEGESPIGTIRQLILLGRGGSGLGQEWTGTGITSSIVAAWNASNPEERSVGYAENGELPNPYAEFRGVAVDDSSILIAYTRTGDANLNGIVDDEDVTIIGAWYDPNIAGRHWHQGDFDFDGYVGDSDSTLIGAFYNPSAQPV